MSLLFNMVSRFIIAFFPKEQASFNFTAAVTTCGDVGASPKKSLPLFPHLFAMKWWDQMPRMILVFWMLSFKPAFSLSSFTSIMRLFSTSLLSAIRVVSSAYLKLLTLLLEILIPVCFLSSLAFCVMYHACKLNNHGDNIQPWCTPFPIWNLSFVPCPVLTVPLDLHTDFSGSR